MARSLSRPTLHLGVVLFILMAALLVTPCGWAAEGTATSSG